VVGWLAAFEMLGSRYLPQIDLVLRLEVIAHARPENVVPKSTATTILSWLPSSFFLLIPVLLARAPT